MFNALCCPFLKFTSLAPLVAIFFIFGLYFMLLSQEEIDVLPIIELRSIAVFANFRLKPLQFNLRHFFYFASGLSRMGRRPRTRTFQTRNADVEARGRYFLIFMDALGRRPGRGRWHSMATVRENFWTRTETRTSGLPGDVDLVPVTGLKSSRPRTSSHPGEAWCKVKILKLNCKIKVAI